MSAGRQPAKTGGTLIRSTFEIRGSTRFEFVA